MSRALARRSRINEIVPLLWMIAKYGDTCFRGAGILPAVSGASRSRPARAGCPRYSGRDAHVTTAVRHCILQFLIALSFLMGPIPSTLRAQGETTSAIVGQVTDATH